MKGSRTDGERRADANLRRQQRMQCVPFNRADAQAFTYKKSETSSPADSHVLMGNDGEPIGSTCPGCYGVGKVMVAEKEMICDVCGGERVVELKKVSAKDAERLRSKLGFFGGSDPNKPPSETGAPFGPTPKGGTPRDEEAQVEGAAPAHKDGRMIRDAQGRTRIGSNTRQMPPVARDRVDAARAARERTLQNVTSQQRMTPEARRAVRGRGHEKK